MEKKKWKQKKKLFRKKFKIMRKDRKKNKNEEIIYEADENGEIFHINNDYNNHEANDEKGISFEEEGNNGNSQEKKEEKKDEVNYNAKSTSSNSNKDELSEFNNLPINHLVSEESDSIIIHTICVNNHNYNNNMIINPEENSNNESNEESNDIFNNDNEITQNVTHNQETE